jgi:hypothetical protein
MRIILASLIGLGWTFYIALLIDRPDLAATVLEPWPKVIHGVFFIVLMRTLYGVSADEIRLSKGRFLRAPSIWLRNLIVVGLGLALMLFTCREVLNGVDPTGLRKLW